MSRYSERKRIAVGLPTSSEEERRPEQPVERRSSEIRRKKPVNRSTVGDMSPEESQRKWDRRMILLARPRLALGIFTILVMFGMALTAFAVRKGDIPPAEVLLLVVVFLAARGGLHRSGSRGWIYLLFAWALTVVCYGALFGSV